jgi:hypothetical protein
MKGLMSHHSGSTSSRRTPYIRSIRVSGVRYLVAILMLAQNTSPPSIFTRPGTPPAHSLTCLASAAMSVRQLISRPNASRPLLGACLSGPEADTLLASPPCSSAPLGLRRAEAAGLGGENVCTWAPGGGVVSALYRGSASAAVMRDAGEPASAAGGWGGGIHDHRGPSGPAGHSLEGREGQHHLDTNLSQRKTAGGSAPPSALVVPTRAGSPPVY